MTPQMDLLYSSVTGHVLAAFTRAAEPAQLEAGAAAFVGDGLRLHGVLNPEVEDLAVPVSEIGLLRIDLQAPVLRDPRSWFWNLAASPPALVELTQALTPTPLATASSVSITSTTPAAFAAGTTVRMLIQGPSLATPLTVSLPATAASQNPITIPVPALASGSYYAIVFVPLYPITATPFTVP
jgi:hypothetical protein